MAHDTIKIGSHVINVNTWNIRPFFAKDRLTVDDIGTVVKLKTRRNMFTGSPERVAYVRFTHKKGRYSMFGESRAPVTTYVTVEPVKNLRIYDRKAHGRVVG